MGGNPLRGEVTFELDGTEVTIRPDWTSLQAIEAALDERIVPLAARVSLRDIGVRDAFVIIAEGMKAAGDDAIAIEDLGERVAEHGLLDLVSPITDFLHFALTGGKEPKKAPKARKK